MAESIWDAMQKREDEVLKERMVGSYPPSSPMSPYHEASRQAKNALGDFEDDIHRGGVKWNKPKEQHPEWKRLSAAHQAATAKEVKFRLGLNKAEDAPKKSPEEIWRAVSAKQKEARGLNKAEDAPKKSPEEIWRAVSAKQKEARGLNKAESWGPKNFNKSLDAIAAELGLERGPQTEALVKELLLKEANIYAREDNVAMRRQRSSEAQKIKDRFKHNVKAGMSEKDARHEVGKLPKSW